MTKVLEAIGLIIALFIGIWVYEIINAPTIRKPIVICRPIAWISGLTANTVTAASDGGQVGGYVDSGATAATEACLRYSARWLQVDKRRPPVAPLGGR